MSKSVDLNFKYPDQAHPYLKGQEVNIKIVGPGDLRKGEGGVEFFAPDGFIRRDSNSDGVFDPKETQAQILHIQTTDGWFGRSTRETHILGRDGMVTIYKNSQNLFGGKTKIAMPYSEYLKSEHYVEDQTINPLQDDKHTKWITDPKALKNLTA